jgi:hypothetical protein
MEKRTSITMSRIVKQTVTFDEMDFETVEEWNEFVLNLESDEDFMLDHFYDNVDMDGVEIIEDVKIVE